MTTDSADGAAQGSANASPRRMTTKAKFAAGLLFVIVRALTATYRIRVFNGEARQVAETAHPHGSFCIALWHEQLLASIVAHRGQKFAPLASLSSDGDIVTWVMARFGFETVRGSSSRGGEKARNGLVQMTNRGFFTAITVDGPRGPRRRVKGGVIDVARRAGVAVLPLITAADRYWTLRSWDQFKVPKPFARLAVCYGEPIIVPESTQGLAFGNAKAAVRQQMQAAEERSVLALAGWSQRG